MALSSFDSSIFLGCAKRAVVDGVQRAAAAAASLLIPAVHASVMLSLSCAVRQQVGGRTTDAARRVRHLPASHRLRALVGRRALRRRLAAGRRLALHGRGPSERIGHRMSRAAARAGRDGKLCTNFVSRRETEKQSQIYFCTSTFHPGARGTLRSVHGSTDSTVHPKRFVRVLRPVYPDAHALVGAVEANLDVVHATARD